VARAPAWKKEDGIWYVQQGNTEDYRWVRNDDGPDGVGRPRVEGEGRAPGGEGKLEFEFQADDSKVGGPTSVYLVKQNGKARLVRSPIAAAKGAVVGKVSTKLTIEVVGERATQRDLDGALVGYFGDREAGDYHPDAPIIDTSAKTGTTANPVQISDERGAGL